MDDSRIVFEVAKANDADPTWLSEYGTRSAWYRRNAAFERCPDFDWEQWDNGDGDRNTEKRRLTRDMIAEVFEETKRPGMKRAELLTLLAERFELGKSTVYRAIGKDGYAGEWLDEVAGIVAMKKAKV